MGSGGGDKHGGLEGREAYLGSEGREVRGEVGPPDDVLTRILGACPDILPDIPRSDCPSLWVCVKKHGDHCAPLFEWHRLQSLFGFTATAVGVGRAAPESDRQRTICGRDRSGVGLGGL